MSLHNKIMNLPCEHIKGDALGLYKRGHKNARHAAAELALEADAELDDAQLIAKALIQNVLEVNGYQGPQIVLCAWIPRNELVDGDVVLDECFWATDIKDGLPVLCDAWRAALRKAIEQ